MPEGEVRPGLDAATQPFSAWSADDLLDAIPVAVFTFDEEGHLVRQNAEARALIGAEANSLQLRDLPRVLGIPPDDIVTTACSWAASPVRKAREEGVASACTVDVVIGGQKRRIEVYARPIGLSEASNRGILVVVRDTTEAARQHEERAAASRMRAVAAIAGRLASEMKSALQRIKTSTDLISERVVVDDVTTRELKSVSKVTKRGTDLADKMLAYARRYELRPIQFDVKALLRSLERLLTALAGPDVRLDLDVRGEGPLRVLMDPRALEQILVELTHNAREALVTGGALSLSLTKETLDTPLSLEGTRIPAGHYACITLTDNGPGMSEGLLARAFDPFFTTGPEGDAAGLGLAMVYGIVKQSGGYVALTSKIGEGTRVRMWLPVEATEDTRDSPVDDKVVQRPIVVIHEDACLRRVISATLESHGRLFVDVPSFRDVKHVLKEIRHQDLTVIFSTESVISPQELEVAFASIATRIDLVIIHDAADGPAPSMHHAKGTSKTVHMPLTPHMLMAAVRQVETTTRPDEMERFS